MNHCAGRIGQYLFSNNRRLFAWHFVTAMLVVLLAMGWAAPDAKAQMIPGLFAQAPAAETAPAPAPEPEEAELTGEALTESLTTSVNDAFRMRAVIGEIIGKLPIIDQEMEDTLRSKGQNGGLVWLQKALLETGIVILFGLGAMQLAGRWGRKQFAGAYKPNVETRADKISYLLFRAVMMTVTLIAFFAAAALVVLILERGQGEAARTTTMVIVSVFMLYLFLRIVFLNILAPDAPSHRMLPLSDADASGLYRSIMAGTLLATMVFALCVWMEELGLNEDAHKLALMLASVLATVILSVIAIVYYRPIRQAILGANPETAPAWRKLVAKLWHVAAVLYFIVAALISINRILLEKPSSTGLVGAPLQVLLFAFIAYGIALLIIDRWILPRLDTEDAQNKIAGDLERADTTEGEDIDSEATAAQAHAEAMDAEAARSPYRALLDHGAAVLITLMSLAYLANIWGVAVFSGGTLMATLLEFSLIIFTGYMAYKAVQIAIDKQIEKESPQKEQDDEIEIGGVGESRVATLLPIFRNFLLITIVVVCAMVALSELGVNVAPLFAGAGVVGLAIGFGAQTLIRDIFSGAFFLIDDAFRKGEYIDIGSVKGIVEKISIRSMQLRHHRGALNTVPFGEIQFVKNYSRDWALMKLAFRVTYDTDVDKMRKIIKRFGQELLEDEYYGPMFLQPLKSQGILSMEDSAMIARVKFMTKPGKQFELRKVVYAGLQDLFEQNGIKFAHKQVTVRVEGDGAMAPQAALPSPEAAKAATLAAAGGAAAAQLEEEAAGAGSASSTGQP